MIVSRYGQKADGDHCPVRGPYKTSPWKGIMQFFQEFKEGLRVMTLTGNGMKKKF